MENIISPLLNNDLEIQKVKNGFNIKVRSLKKVSLEFLIKFLEQLINRKIIWFIMVFIGPVLLLYIVMFTQDNIVALIPPANSKYITEENVSYEKLKKQTLNNIVLLHQKLNRKIPGSSYLVINSSTNEFKLYSGVKEIRKGICSTGSYTLLESNDNQRWLFKTPRGVLRIQGKTENPVWKKPDWAFIEEGLPVPSKTDNSRYEYGTLGEYALSLGNGYLIHGTLYKRFLGMPVTHGCVRMSDEDLEAIYNTLSIGSKVFIF